MFVNHLGAPYGYHHRQRHSERQALLIAQPYYLFLKALRIFKKQVLASDGTSKE